MSKTTRDATVADLAPPVTIDRSIVPKWYIVPLRPREPGGVVKVEIVNHNFPPLTAFPVIEGDESTIPPELETMALIVIGLFKENGDLRWLGDAVFRATDWKTVK